MFTNFTIHLYKLSPTICTQQNLFRFSALSQSTSYLIFLNASLTCLAEDPSNPSSSFQQQFLQIPFLALIIFYLINLKDINSVCMLTTNKSACLSVSLHTACSKILPNCLHNRNSCPNSYDNILFLPEKRTRSPFTLLELLLVVQGYYLRCLFISFGSLNLFSSHQIEATYFHFQGFVLPTSALPLLPLFLIYSSRTDSMY